MIKLLGEITMKIEGIKIYKLHDMYNYEIDFNNDLTFLYGSNGCGKTTVLNILSAIITGRMYNLVEYTFNNIILSYLNEDNTSQNIEIKNRLLDDKRNMIIEYNSHIFEIEDIDNLKELLYRKCEDDDLDRVFYQLYPAALNIKKMFNYVYLPLSRYGNVNYGFYDSGYRRYIMHRNRFTHQFHSYNTYLNESLLYIKDLIRKKSNEISFEENRINEEFRNKVLSSSISVQGQRSINDILSQIDNFNWDEVVKSKDMYIKFLKGLNVYKGTTKTQIDKFFDQFKTIYDDYQSKDDSEKEKIKLDFAWQYAEFLKINNIATLAKENEEAKEKIRQPKEIFLRVINEFFDVAGSGKNVSIESQGEIYFNTSCSQLKLDDLSSGEKQIVITFASLIFGLIKGEKGIFIVDEPEASLHLEWQSKFVSEILNIDSNIQLIFATHSPELIGKYRNKAIKLIKEVK